MICAWLRRRLIMSLRATRAQARALRRVKASNDDGLTAAERKNRAYAAHRKAYRADFDRWMREGRP